MAPLRRLLGPVTAIWLFCQLGTAASVPVSLWLRTVDPHASECICGHGAGAMCPMHHKLAGGSVPCAMQSANGPDAAILTTLLGTAGVIAEAAASIRPAVPSPLVRAGDVQPAGERPVPPDPPPPRV